MVSMSWEERIELEEGGVGIIVKGDGEIILGVKGEI